MDEDTKAKSADDADALIDDETDAEESIPLTAYEVSFYALDYLVDGIVQRLGSDDILILQVGTDLQDGEYVIPGFQRPFVWSTQKSDKFIESLLMGLPVPGIFLARTSEGVLLVLDGQQRLETLRKFYTGNRKLGNSVQQMYRQKTYNTLADEDRRRLDNSVIHATVVRQESPGDYDSIYHIFERLNSGGEELTPQQIRMALYHGTFSELLLELNQNGTWRKLIRQKTSDLAFKKFKDIEMILRFFALFHDSGEYKNPMKNFLNKFMAKHRNIESSERKQYEQLFCDTVKFINQSMGDSAFCGKGKRPSAAIVDSLMYGVAKRLISGVSLSSQEAQNAVEAMLEDQDYQEAIGKRTSMVKHVKQRLNLSEQAFCRQ